MQPTVMPMTKDDFWRKYWFSPLQMVTLINPKSEDYKFMVEMRNFVIKAGTKEKMPGTVANVYLSQMTRIIAQDEDKMQHLSDFALMKQYFDRLIVDVESLVAEDHSQPEYLKNVPAHMHDDNVPEAPPWQQSQAPSSIPETNSQMRDTIVPDITPETQPEQAPATQQEVVETGNEQAANPVKENKEFTLNDDKFSMVIAKDGKRMYYKNGKLTSGADYNKAVSMLG